MNLHTLTPAAGSVKKVKRIGRGQGSGHGRKSTRGSKGAGQRSGTKHKRGFEGGQMPLQRRLPKFGFKNINRIEFQTFNLDSLTKISEKYGVTDITREFLVLNGYAHKNDKIKILGRGAITTPMQVQVHAISEKARQIIEAAGGKVTLIVIEPKVEEAEAPKAAKAPKAEAPKAQAPAPVAEVKATVVEAPKAEAPAAEEPKETPTPAEDKEEKEGDN